MRDACSRNKLKSCEGSAKESGGARGSGRKERKPGSDFRSWSTPQPLKSQTAQRSLLRVTQLATGQVCSAGGMSVFADIYFPRSAEYNTVEEMTKPLPVTKSGPGTVPNSTAEASVDTVKRTRLRSVRPRSNSSTEQGDVGAELTDDRDRGRKPLADAVRLPDDLPARLHISLLSRKRSRQRGDSRQQPAVRRAPGLGRRPTPAA